MRAHSIVFHSNAEGSLLVDLSTRLAILEPVVELIGRLPRCSTIVGSWMRSRGVNLGPTGRPGARARARAWARVRAAEVAAPKSVRAMPHKVLRNPINRLRRDPNLDSATYNITKIKT